MVEDRTNAERQRRYIERLKARAGAVSNRLDAAEIVALKAENASLKARIAELVKAGTRKPVTKPADPDSDLARAKATITDLRARLRYFQKRPEGRIDSRSYTIIRSRMHPDRVSDPEKKARYKIAFEVFGELEKRVVDEEQSFLTSAPSDVYLRKSKAKKRQPAAPPKPPRSLAR